MLKFPRVVKVLCVLACALFALAARAGETPKSIAWQRQWTEALFAQAAREHRFVLLDLHAAWCHWCHVMDDETYTDASVVARIGARYLPISVDADSDPALSSRYGDWGWPATIILASDGTEIVKRRGFIAPQQMASLLQAIIDDPSPGPSVARARPAAAAAATLLGEVQRAALRRSYQEAYDAKYGGWGSGQKFIDAATLEYTLTLVLEERQALAERRARQTLAANLRLIDPVFGGVFQYSATPDWNSPHYEKLLSFQADDLRIYSEAYARWHDPRYLAAALTLHRYMDAFLRSAQGAFYVSQDADVSASVTGHDYYPRDEAQRARLGMPKVDTHRYARENGWAIRALCALHDATANADALAEAERAALWVLAHRSLAGGGFRHDETDGAGPYLDDTVSMGQALLALYRSSGERHWLSSARASMDYIVRTFQDARGGFMAAPAPAGASGVFRDSSRSIEENAAVVRFANLLQHYSGEDRYRNAALHAMKFLAGASRAGELRMEVLLADRELQSAPIHITVVGAKGDPRAQALHTAALQFPASYLQVDWWDRAEGPLPGSQVQYPSLSRAAAFACTGSSCSLPLFEAAAVGRTVTAALYQ
ncbi:MAG TPA: DUF255 domain-containing protein [Steroidobacteraceae bacterium]